MTKSGENAIDYEELCTLPEWVVVQSESSQILYVPWQKVVNAALRARGNHPKSRETTEILRWHS